ncbi:MAG: undecaprenyl-diphosphate phosphatase [Gemmatimonadales bacterium]|nr:undecaprenyl-diphosphate phosphatase [Gemmatimonadales bacterium]
MSPYIAAVVLGLVEGATEFIPVSSTGHLILAGHWLGFEGAAARAFEIFIQLGAILSIVWLYRARLVALLRDALHAGPARRLVVSLLVAFLPVAVVGLLAHGWIKEHLFDPRIVAVALVVGGIVMLLIERWNPRIRVIDVAEVEPPTALGIGLAQVLSLVPGTSRSGATILGGYSLGLSRKAATEFSFFLAIPVMCAATAFDLFKSRHDVTSSDAGVFAVGFVVSFITSIVIVRAFVRYISQHSFRPFAWYRIVFGLTLLAFQLARG